MNDKQTRAISDAIHAALLDVFGDEYDTPRGFNWKVTFLTESGKRITGYEEGIY